MRERNVPRYGIRTLAACLLGLALTAAPAASQTTENATTTTGGNWTDSSIWACTPALSPCLPNNNASDVFSVTIGDTVTLDSTSSLTSVTVSTLDTPLSSDLYVNSETLTVAGAVTSSGSLLVGAVSSPGVGVLTVGGNLTNDGYIQAGAGAQSGGGTVTVSGNVINSGSIEVAPAGNVYIDGTLTNSSGASVQLGGSSDIGSAISAGEVANSGIVEVSAIATLGAGTYVQTGTGSQTINSAAVTANSLDIEGGTFTDDFGVTDVGMVSGQASGGINIGSNGNLIDDATITVIASQYGAPGTVDNAGSVAVGGKGTMTLAGGYTQTGGTTSVEGALSAASLDVEGGTYTNDAGVTNLGGATGTTPGSINVAGGGTLTDDASVVAGAKSAPGSVRNAGTVSVGTSGTLTLLDGGAYKQTGGTTSVDGTVSAASLVVNGGTYTNGAGVTKLGSVSGTPASGSISIGSSGKLTDNATIKAGATRTPGTVNNAGSVTLGSKGTITLADGGSYKQTGGTTDVNGTLIALKVTIDGGVLAGDGRVEGATTIAADGRLSPGIQGIGKMTFGASASSLDLLGTWDESVHSSSLFSVADVNGELSLGPHSVLDMFLSPSYDPKVGTKLTIADFGRRSGIFGRILNDTFDGGKEDWIATYNSTDILLTVGAVKDPGDPPAATPEPGSPVLISLGMGFLGIACLFRRRAVRRP